MTFRSKVAFRQGGDVRIVFAENGVIIEVRGPERGKTQAVAHSLPYLKQIIADIWEQERIKPDD